MQSRGLFIGCSDEASHVAFEVKAVLEAKFKKRLDVKVFKETEWKNLTAILDNLRNRLDEYYYAVFIGYPDDVVLSRNEFYYSCRDNVLFEMGLFLSRVGRDRTFFVLPNKLNYNGARPIQLDTVNTKKDIEFKLLSDFGKSLVINSRIKLSYQKAKRKNPDTGKFEFYDKWLPEKDIKDELKQLVADIETQEGLLDASKSNSITKESEIVSISRTIVEDIRLHKGEKEEFYINKLVNELPSLIYKRSRASEKQVQDTVIDVIELIAKFKDFLDVEQLARRQSYKAVKKVWVLADMPVEFDQGTHKDKKVKLQKTILENLKKGVQYTYIVNHKFDTRDIEVLFSNNSEKEKVKLRKNIKIIKVDSKHFKTFFTLHFANKRDNKPDEIYMSALLPDREDLLIQISDNVHHKRVFERINKLVGYDRNDNTYAVRDYVVSD